MKTENKVPGEKSLLGHLISEIDEIDQNLKQKKEKTANSERNVTLSTPKRPHKSICDEIFENIAADSEVL